MARPQLGSCALKLVPKLIALEQELVMFCS
jgi:hypothetical protein